MRSVAASKSPQPDQTVRALRGARGQAEQEEPVQGSAVHGEDHPVGGALMPALPISYRDLERMLSDLACK
jgi:hypothetical protein